ncbi:hypothetical protein DICPUDRAFT_159898 [Dictyostelium purpureum]|uniref:Prolyl 4-hydroxylase alpha subunit domain-containing protein n=1 Tax=Dictyostelium purpureum TaxID=5786 RepID=F1A584_DICPU|nr:uncharacterized protein DICPUDRAFT_159898 [Dictyostelium purpureum]EGC28644.1 hypothetical protein DICPUDRAFT_159898 [Dictyostelium purpureum]|eukprot:XP_003294829.1 hypothetical protein DICPUDRAFT_159898 [Dictyostelium purpureum]
MANYKIKEVFPNSMVNKRKVIAFVIKDVFSSEECDEWINITEEKGYEKALLNIGGGEQILAPEVRNNDRCIIDSEEMADKIYQRVKHLLPNEMNYHEKVSLNERLRFLRYYPGQEFKLHSDGQYCRESGPKKGECSFITIQLYLNKVEKGGETSFLTSKYLIEKEKYIHVKPKKGSVLIFQHDLSHKGSAVEKGIKYCVRSDIMYKPIPNTKSN